MHRPGWKTLTAVAVGAVIVGVGAPLAVTSVGSAGRVHTVDELAEQDNAADVAVVLGAQVHPDGRPSRYLRARLDRAVELQRRGLVKVILVSGDNSTSHYDEPTAMKRYLVEAGMPEGKVVIDYAGFDTYDTCVRAKRIFGLERVVLVSQGYHLPRAVTTCRMVGVDAVGVGDWSVQRIGPMDGVPVLWRLGWSRFAGRELPANVKMLWDVASRRTPTLGEPETGVSDALASS
ncbi:SanA/YdcF family protein [Luteococcus japonicus]|uniref:Putative integral membrane protein n=1 Tax=Luteococcus japonicus LSP_Lj1 TaxID=1255658 RepID=A0A1R4KJB8_9ACTN|nr:ElyC/SanA/YdcF family protein [Luteococcus japonicus]SJN44325.1 putative integral membrane protein [Luteococcus japonicus LSP_Lj1]